MFRDFDQRVPGTGTPGPRRATEGLVAAVAAVAIVAGACGSGRSGARRRATRPPRRRGGREFGDLATPCGPGPRRRCARLGVTDTTVTIGYGDDAGYRARRASATRCHDAVRP